MNIYVLIRECILMKEKYTYHTRNPREGETQYDLNEEDLVSLEQALLLKEKANLNITAILLTDRENSAARELFALGADNVIQFINEAEEVPAVSTLARLISQKIKRTEVDLFLVGDRDCLGVYDVMSAFLSKELAIPLYTNVDSLKQTEQGLEITRSYDQVEESLHIPKQAILTCQKGEIAPRLPKMQDIVKVSEKVAEQVFIDSTLAEVPQRLKRVGLTKRLKNTERKVYEATDVHQNVVDLLTDLRKDGVL